MSVDTTTRDSQASSSEMTFGKSSRLVAEREIRTQLRMKGFWFTFGLLVAGIFAATLLPGMFGGGAPTVATVGSNAERAVAAADLELQPATNVAEAEELVRDGEVDAAVVPDQSGAQSPLGFRLIALSSPPTDVVEALSVSPPVDLLDDNGLGEAARSLVTFAFALIFMMFSIGFGMAIAQSVVTEKQTRIVEILVSTVPVRALLAGKVAAHSILVFAQVLALAVVTAVMLRIDRQELLLSMLGQALGWFVPFFALGFVLLATMWAVAGSVVSRQEDLGSSTSVLMMVAMLPYFGVIFLQDNALAMTILSYVPFSAAVAMPVRLFTGDAQTWEPFLALALLVVSVVASVVAAARLYSGSLLRTGSRVKLGQAWSQAE